MKKRSQRRALAVLVLPVAAALAAAGCAETNPITPQSTILTIAGDRVQSFGGDGGPARAAQLNGPYGIAFDSTGNLHFSDYYNHRIRRIEADTGVISTVVGTGLQGFSGDGGPADRAQINGPYGIAIDGDDNIFFTDYFNQRIRRIDGRSGIITTVAGDGRKGFDGDGGPAVRAALTLPLDVKLDRQGNLFLSDYVNSRIRRVDGRTGVITTVAGNGRKAFEGDGGPATAAALNEPYSMTLDRRGNLFIADYENHRIRRVDGRTGIITTLAGTGNKGDRGDGGPATAAELHGPYGMVVDGAGNLIFSDSENDRVRKIDLATGVIEAVVGTGEPGYGGDGGPAIDARLHGPYSLALEAAGDLYVAEYFNHTIRRVRASGAASPVAAGRGDRTPDELARLAAQIFGAISADRPANADPVVAERVALGQRLFFDRRLSRSQELSCSTCHDLNKGGVDHKPVSEGHRGQKGEFNAPTLFNASLQGRQFWDARAVSLEDQAKKVLLSQIEMAMHGEDQVERVVRSIPGYGPLFARAFPDRADPITFDSVVAAIAEFQRRLVTPALIDRFMRGEHDALDERQRHGLELFIDKGCAGCHLGPGLGGMTMGLEIPFPAARPDPFVFQDNLGREGYFKVPQLRNVAQTAPFLHDGSIAELDEAIRTRLDHYSYGFRAERTTPRLDEAQIDDLIAFLDSLNGRLDPAYRAEPEPLPAGPNTPGPDPS